MPASRPTTAAAKHHALPRGGDALKNGDKVIITQGDFNGQWGSITDKDVIGDEPTVALGEDGRDIRAHEAHVERRVVEGEPGSFPRTIRRPAT